MLNMILEITIDIGYSWGLPIAIMVAAWSISRAYRYGKGVDYDAKQSVLRFKKALVNLKLERDARRGRE